MEQMKVVHEASQVAYNTSTALQANAKVSWFPTSLLTSGSCNCYFIVHKVSLDERFGTFTCIYHGSAFRIQSPIGVFLT